jgi:hypothetical protein
MWRRALVQPRMTRGTFEPPGRRSPYPGLRAYPAPSRRVAAHREVGLNRCAFLTTRDQRRVCQERISASVASDAVQARRHGWVRARRGPWQRPGALEPAPARGRRCARARSPRRDSGRARDRHCPAISEPKRAPRMSAGQRAASAAWAGVSPGYGAGRMPRARAGGGSKSRALGDSRATRVSRARNAGKSATQEGAIGDRDDLAPVEPARHLAERLAAAPLSTGARTVRKGKPRTRPAQGIAPGAATTASAAQWS